MALLVIATALLGCGGSPAPAAAETASESHPDGRFSNAAEAEANARRERIRAEIAELGEHPWAGEYYFGDHFGVNVNVALAPKTGYVFEWHGCMGWYDRNWGAVREEDGQLHLEFTFANRRGGFQGCAPVLVPVHYDATHHYLAEPSELADAAPGRDHKTLARRR